MTKRALTIAARFVLRGRARRLRRRRQTPRPRKPPICNSSLPSIPPAASTQRRFELQKQGYVAAFRNPRVLDAIRSGRNQAIAVTMTQWTGPGAAGAGRAVDAARATRRRSSDLQRRSTMRRGNCFSAAPRSAAPSIMPRTLFPESPFKAERQVDRHLGRWLEQSRTPRQRRARRGRRRRRHHQRVADHRAGAGSRALLSRQCHRRAGRVRDRGGKLRNISPTRSCAS